MKRTGIRQLRPMTIEVRCANWFGVEPMKVLALQGLTAQIENQIQPGSPDRTRLERRVPSETMAAAISRLDPMD